MIRNQSKTLSVLSAALAYFALVFGAGFILGMVRVPLLVPRLGVRIAELLEMPFMFVVIVYSAGWVVRRFQLPSSAWVRVLVGGVALALLLSAEVALAVAISRVSLAQYIAGKDPVSGTVYLVLLGIYAAMPLLLAQARRA